MDAAFLGAMTSSKLQLEQLLGDLHRSESGTGVILAAWLGCLSTRRATAIARDSPVVGPWDGRVQHVIGRVTDAIQLRYERSRLYHV